MSILNKETKNVQNPALAAVLLWRFALGYSEGSKVEAPAPIPLLYVVLSILFHEETTALLESTNKPSGLRGFASKFTTLKESKSDLLLSIHDRSLKFRDLTKRAIAHSVSANLLGILVNEGSAAVLTKTTPKVGISQAVTDLSRQAEKLGFWCGQLSLHEISVILKIGF